MDEWSQWCCWSDLKRERAVKLNNCHYKCSAEPSCLCDTRHLLWMQDGLFSFVLLYLLLSPYFVWATCALYSFILHKLAEAICQKSSKNYIPQYVWQRAWVAQSNSVLVRLWWLFCRSRCEWHLFSNLPASCLSTSKGQGLIVEWIRAAGILLDIFNDDAK